MELPRAPSKSIDPQVSIGSMDGSDDISLINNNHRSLQRLNSQPTTAAEMDLISASSHEKMRLKSLATIRKLLSCRRDGVGAIITEEELELLESTLAISVKLSNSHILAMQNTAEKTLDCLKKSDKGYLLDDEMYNSLKSFMTVTVEQPMNMLMTEVAKRGASPSMSFGLAGELLPSYLTESVTRWGFDVIDVDEKTNKQALVWVCETLMSKSGLLDCLDINKSNLHCWLYQVNENYLAENPYHNSVHGADVCQSLYCLMESGTMLHSMSNKSKFAILLSAVAHDVAHPGYNANFLINSNDPIAVRYHYDSPLEHLHSAKSFELMRIPGCDVLSFFDGESMKEVRKMMVNNILATDMENHFGSVSTLSRKLETTGVLMANSEDATLICGMMLHAADVSNPAKKWEYYTKWIDLVMQEFYRQGDREREVGMRITKGYDRENPTPQSKFQNGFMAFVVQPLYECLHKTEYLDLSVQLEQINDNLAIWAKRALEEESGMS